MLLPLLLLLAGACLAVGSGEVAGVSERGVVTVREGRRRGGSGGLDVCARRCTARGATGEASLPGA